MVFTTFLKRQPARGVLFRVTACLISIVRRIQNKAPQENLRRQAWDELLSNLANANSFVRVPGINPNN